MANETGFYDIGLCSETRAKLQNHIKMAQKALDKLDMPETITNEHLEWLKDTIESRTSAILSLIEKAEKAANDIFEQHEETYRRIKKSHDCLCERIKKLPPLPDINISTMHREVIDLATRYDYLTDNQWQKLVELSKALAV